MSFSGVINNPIESQRRQNDNINEIAAVRGELRKCRRGAMKVHNDNDICDFTKVLFREIFEECLK